MDQQSLPVPNNSHPDNKCKDVYHDYRVQGVKDILIELRRPNQQLVITHNMLKLRARSTRSLCTLIAFGGGSDTLRHRR